MFKQVLIVVLYKKKGNRFDCGNYLLLSLLSGVYMLFMSSIAARAWYDIYASFPETRVAYQAGRGSSKQILAIEQITEKSIEFNNSVHINGIHFTKAFDIRKLSSL